MPAINSQAGRSEPFNFALARRTLTQQVPFKMMERSEQLETARGLVVDARELATGFEVTRSDASKALVRQQLTVADDIADLFPGDQQMQMASAQFKAKATEHGQELERPAAARQGLGG